MEDTAPRIFEASPYPARQTPTPPP